MRFRGSWRVRALALAAGLAGAACGPPPPRLLLLVTVDTLRADQLGAYGSTRGLTPHLDALAAESTVFDAAYSAAPLTLPSLTALMTGRYPEDLGMRTNESAVPASAGTLADTLARSGWSTAAVVGNFVLRRSSGIARGFEWYDDRFPQHEAVRHWPERIAASTTDAALPLLADCTERSTARCFLWVHYQDPHGPYDPPGERRQRLLEAERAAPDGRRELPPGPDQSGLGSIPAYQMLGGHRDVAFYRAGYRGEIEYVDQEIGRLLAEVERLGLADRSIVVFAADHGESLGEGDIWFAHGARLTDEQVRVPLFLRLPGRAPARRSDVVSLVDLRPTLLALVAGAAPEAGLPGRDLLARGAQSGSTTAYMATLGASPRPEHAVIDDGYKLIVPDPGSGGGEQLHALGHDDVDLGAAAPQVLARLRERLAATQSLFAPEVRETPQTLSAEERRTLGALGYLEPGSDAGK